MSSNLKGIFLLDLYILLYGGSVLAAHMDVYYVWVGLGAGRGQKRVVNCHVGAGELDVNSL